MIATKTLALIIAAIIATASGAGAYIATQPPQAVADEPVLPDPSPSTIPQNITDSTIYAENSTVIAGEGSTIITPSPAPTSAPTQAPSNPTAPPTATPEPTQQPLTTQIIYEWFLDPEYFETYNFKAYNETTDGVTNTRYNTTDYTATIKTYVSYDAAGLMDHNNTGLVGYTQIKVTSGDTTAFETFIEGICDSHGWIKYEWHTGDEISRHLT